MRRPARFILAEVLEPRRLFSAVYPTTYEQYMVELYNWARANPDAVAAKYGVALNEGIAPGMITSAAKQPVAINPYLTDGARNYAQYMIDHDLFGHTVDGNQPGDRMQAAGYLIAWSWGENIAMVSSSGTVDQKSAVETEFGDYYVDGDIAGRGHRLNMLNPQWKEIGSGQAVGPFNGWNTVMTVQDLAYKGTGSFLTGVAYTDTSHDNFYTPGEQMAGVTIQAVRNSDSATFTTTTWSSGGYSLALPDGTYTVWASGGTLGGWVRYNNVVVGPENVKRDFRPDLVNSSGPGSSGAFAQLSNGRLTVTGTTGNDAINLVVSAGVMSVTQNGTTLTFNAASVTSIVISAGDGNDSVTIGAGVGNAVIYGDNGNDSLQGGNGKDVLHGGAGDDRLMGGGNNDKLYGEAGNDSLWGQKGDDLLDGGTGADCMSGGPGIDTVDYSARTAALFVELVGLSSQATGRSGETRESDNCMLDIENVLGGAGNDTLTGNASANVIRGGAGNDVIYGMAGADSLFGNDGKDRFFAVDSTTDYLDGGAAADTASCDLTDTLISIETH